MIKIGIFLPPFYTSEVGGGYFYLISFLEIVKNLKLDQEEIEFCTIQFQQGRFEKTLEENVILKNYPLTFLNKVSLKTGIFSKCTQKIITKKNSVYFENQLLEEKISIIFYPIQNFCPLDNFPFVSNNWDSGELSSFGFPELVEGIEFLRRKEIKDKTLKKSMAIFVESLSGKLELKNYYNIVESKTFISPLLPNYRLIEDQTFSKNVLQKFDLKENNYFFYPAKFWPHKNHINLFFAFSEIVKENSEVKLVLTGSTNLTEFNLFLKNKISELNLEKNVIVLGNVDDVIIRNLYKYSIGLVMPTFIGPTNMPLIEAMALGTPVACSNLDGHKEILGDLGCYFDPSNQEEILNSLRLLYNERNNLVLKEKLTNRFDNSVYSLDNYKKTLVENFKKLKLIRQTWPY